MTRHESVDDTWECLLLWAGDSRVYLLRPGSGLAQLTTDDIRDQGDAMTNLRQDLVISNAMSADTAFVINQRRVRLRGAFLIVAATAVRACTQGRRAESWRHAKTAAPPSAQSDGG